GRGRGRRRPGRRATEELLGLRDVLLGVPDLGLIRREVAVLERGVGIGKVLRGPGEQVRSGESGRWSRRVLARRRRGRTRRGIVGELAELLQRGGQRLGDVYLVVVLD